MMKRHLMVLLIFTMIMIIIVLIMFITGLKMDTRPVEQTLETGISAPIYRV